MKKLFIAAITLTCLTACVRPIPELPAETQTGAKTFGCLVNGELVIPYYENSLASSYDYNPHAVYDRIEDRLRITGYGQNYQFFEFTVNLPENGLSAPIDKVRYFPPNSNGDYYYGGENIGNIILTRFDLTQRIVSGTFNFTGYKHDANTEELIDSNDFVMVTLGRFDIRMN